MKKTLLSVLAGIVVIGSASAVPSPGDRKALCEKQSDKYVWVEVTQACVPINPCLSDNQQIKEAYCDTVFSDIRVRNYDAAETLVDRYLNQSFSNTLIPNRMIKPRPDTRKYVVANDRDHGSLSRYDYRIFEFQEIGYDGAKLAQDAFIGACNAYMGNVRYDDGIAKCSYYRNATCSDISDLAALVYGGVLGVNPVYVMEEEYTGSRYPEHTQRETGCEFKIY